MMSRRLVINFIYLVSSLEKKNRINNFKLIKSLWVLKSRFKFKKSRYDDLDYLSWIKFV